MWGSAPYQFDAENRKRFPLPFQSDWRSSRNPTSQYSVHIYIYIYTYLFIYLFVYLFIYVFIYTYYIYNIGIRTYKYVHT